jgi:hypothetical protein
MAGIGGAMVAIFRPPTKELAPMKELAIIYHIFRCSGN